MQHNDLPTSLRETILQFSPGMVDDLMTRRISTGFSGLDQALGGGLSPGLYVLGAIPNLGKSTFALQIAQSIRALHPGGSMIQWHKDWGLPRCERSDPECNTTTCPPPCGRPYCSFPPGWWTI